MPELELPQDHIAEAIELASLEAEEPPRPHFGLSTAGHHCQRWLWLSFRWAVVKLEHNPSEKSNIRTRGQLLRLFQRGHDEEARVRRLLEKVGCVFAEPWQYKQEHEQALNSEPEQFRVSYGNHISGSMDGIIISGVPGAEKSVHIWENKTHGLKSFEHLLKHGLEESKPMHWAQCQSYMHGTHKKDFLGPRLVKRTLYTGICKDDDRIYTRRVKYDPEAAQRLEDRSHGIVAEPGPPLGVSADPSWYQCKMCDGWDLCHGSKVTREINCRTCAHSTPERDGSWSCARHGGAMPISWTREAHECHAMHPSLVPWPIASVENGRDPVFETEAGMVSGSEKLVKLSRKEG
jgi:hypothetical protein